MDQVVIGEAFMTLLILGAIVKIDNGGEESFAPYLKPDLCGKQREELEFQWTF